MTGSAVAWKAIESGNACPTWNLWGESLLGTELGQWTLSALSSFFGPDYMYRQTQRPPAALFNQAIYPGLGASRVVRVVELAARIVSVRNQQGWLGLRREATRDTQPAYFTHLQALLAVAAPLAGSGWAVDLAPPSATTTPAGQRTSSRPDLRAANHHATFTLEVKSPGEDQAFRVAERFNHEVCQRTWLLEHRLGHGVSVTCGDPCDPDELDAWTTRVVVAAAAHQTMVPGPGTGPTELLPQQASGSFTGAPVAGDLWGRLALQIHNAARQLRGNDRAWVLLEDRGTLPWATQWGQMALPDKLAHLTSAVRGELIGLADIAGIVLTTGPRNTTSSPVTEETVHASGCVALRRNLLGYRYRETFIIRPTTLLSPTPGITGALAYPDALALFACYDTEGTWLPAFLTNAGLPDPASLGGP